MKQTPSVGLGNVFIEWISYVLLVSQDTYHVSEAICPQDLFNVEKIVRTYGIWDVPLRNTTMKPNTRLSNDDYDSNPKPDFNAAIVASWEVSATLSLWLALIWPGLARNSANTSNSPAKRTWMQLNTSSSITVKEWITYTRGARNANELWGWVYADWAGDTDTRRSHTTSPGLATSSWWMMDPFPFLGEAADKTTCRSLPPKLNLLQPVKQAKKSFTFVRL